MQSLDSLIEDYGLAKEKEKLLKVNLNALNTDIKNILRNTEGGIGRSDSFEAKFQVVKSESFDEPRLISLFLTVPFAKAINDEYNIIEYVPQLNPDALEKAIYDGRLDPAALNDYKKVTEIERLTVKRKKEDIKWKKRSE